MDSGWNREQEWFWEGNIRTRVLEYMQQDEGFSILSSGHLTNSEMGIEVVAERVVGGHTVHRLVTVLGWPSHVYTRGTMAGQPRNTRPEVSARGWIAQAIFDLALGRGADPDLDLALALPTMASYIRYLQRLRWFLASARVSVYLISQEGQVSVTPPGAAPVSAFAPQPQAARPGGRRKLGLPGATRLQMPLLHVLALAGGTASRTACIRGLVEWFPEVPNPAPSEFGQRVSIAQNVLQDEGLTETAGRGVWSITEAGREAHENHWKEWLERENRNEPVEAVEQAGG
jgi:hypothetical protein